MTVFIYTLKDPDTDEIRYVGKTQEPEKRLRGHKSTRDNSYRSNWMQSLQDRGVAPVLEIIDEVNLEDWPQWEVAYIEYFRELGCRLVNATVGGEGGCNPSLETREKMRAAKLGKSLSSEHRRKLKLARAGRKPALGMTHSLEAKEKISRAGRGRKLSLEHIEKIRISKLGDNNPMSSVNIRRRAEQGIS